MDDLNLFQRMSLGEKLKTLGQAIPPAASYAWNDWTGMRQHLEYPEHLRTLLKEYHPELGMQRYKGGPLDRAMNYGGGYQFGSTTTMPISDAEKLAKSYQLLQAMRGINTPQEAARDYYQNMAGVRAGRMNKDVVPNIGDKSALYAKTSLEESLKPTEAEKNIINYHRNTIKSGKVGSDEEGRPVTVYSTGIRIPSGKYKGKFVAVPGYVGGRIITNEDELYDIWKEQINDGDWPIYKSGEELNKRSQQLHQIMDDEESAALLSRMRGER